MSNKKNLKILFKIFHPEKGAALLITFFIMGIALSVILGISAILISEIKMIRGMGYSVNAIYAADTGIEKLLYENNQCRQNVPPCDTLLPPCEGDLNNDSFCDGLQDAYESSGVLDNTAQYNIKVIADDFQSFGIYKGTTRAIELNFTIIPIPWVCGDTLIDSRDGKIYATVQIGNQCWMKENLNVGTMLCPGETTCATNQTNNGTIEKYCYNNQQSYCDTDGGLYQWDEAMQYVTTSAQGICPTGWHIPTHDEWTTLERAVCTSGTCATDFPYDATTYGWRGTNEGTKLKSGGTSGFDALLAGRRSTDGSFYGFSSLAYIWSSLQSGSDAWTRTLLSLTATVYRTTFDKLSGFSVRCLRD